VSSPAASVQVVKVAESASVSPVISTNPPVAPTPTESAFPIAAGPSAPPSSSRTSSIPAAPQVIPRSVPTKLGAADSRSANQPTPGERMGSSSSPAPVEAEGKERPLPSQSVVPPPLPEVVLFQAPQPARQEALRPAAGTDHLDASPYRESPEPRKLDLPTGNGERRVSSTTSQTSSRKPESEPKLNPLVASTDQIEKVSLQQTLPREAGEPKAIKFGYRLALLVRFREEELDRGRHGKLQQLWFEASQRREHQGQDKRRRIR